MKKIGIIDYGMGNLHSVKNALDHIGVENFVTSDINELDLADGLILPGVGAFGDAIAALKATETDEYLRRYAADGRPLLGICLGMQLLADKSYEMGEWEGLGLIGGEVVRLTAGETDRAYKIPHMGWNSVKNLNRSPLTENVADDTYFYFVHSYKFEVKDRNDLLCVTDYGEEIAAIVGKGNVYGAQFHPEKSEDTGLNLLKQFYSII